MTTPDSNSANDEHLRETYARMSDEELETVAADAADLTSAAQALVSNEMKQRSLAVPAVPPTESHEVEQQMWSTVAKFRDLPEALLAKGCIESSGIECHLADDNMVRLDWFISNLIGGVKIVVKPEDEADARAILAQPIPETFEASGEHYEQPTCPKCKSLDVNFQEVDPMAYVAAWMSVPIPLERKAWRCRSCSAEWEEVADPISPTSNS